MVQRENHARRQRCARARPTSNPGCQSELANNRRSNNDAAAVVSSLVVVAVVVVVVVVVGGRGRYGRW